MVNIWLIKFIWLINAYCVFRYQGGLYVFYKFYLFNRTKHDSSGFSTDMINYGEKLFHSH